MGVIADMIQSYKKTDGELYTAQLYL